VARPPEDELSFLVMKKNRPPLACERLEAREVLTASVCTPAPPAVAPALGPVEVALPAPSADRTPLALIAQPMDVAAGGAALSRDAVGAYFACSPEWAGLALPFAPAVPRGRRKEAAPAERPVAAPAPGVEEAAWLFLRNYARKAIRREERVRGPLPDHGDIIQDIYVAWRQEVGRGHDAHANLLERDSPERLAFGKTVRRVLDRARYGDARRRRDVPLTDHEAPRLADDWHDLEIDWAQGVGGLSENERRLLSLRREGRTFEEIGSEIGLAKQRVCELFNEVIGRLTALYGG